MKQLLKNLKLTLSVFLIISLVLLGGVVYQQNRSQKLLLQSSNESKSALRSRYADAGTIWTADRVALAYSENGERHYAEPELAKALIQVVGDYTQNIGNTLEGSYQDRLIGAGRPLHQQIWFDLNGRGMKGDDLVLTLDSEVCLAAARQLEGLRGSIVILNYINGDLLCLVSTPGTYPENVISWTDIPESSLFDRSILGSYAPGSTFKIVTGSAWLNSERYSAGHTVLCKGSEPLLGPGSVNENRDDSYHGEVNLQQAFQVSCNHFFGEVGLQTGAKALAETAEQFGFNRSLKLDRLAVKSGVYQADENDQYLLTWQAIGQPIEKNLLTLSPLHLAMIAGGVANKGEMMQPHLVKHLISPLNRTYEEAEQSVFSKINSPDAMETIKQDLIATVSGGMASAAAIEGYRVGGKTGTAQSLDQDGQLKVNSMYTGFIDDPAHPYAIAVVIEDGFYDTPAVAAAMLRTVIARQE